ncbi:hypothetical protein B296_00033595 [Ensete ventricosum]|uniref:Uncharacterized protein n=1 Tax=Ensete ventricosum TaxID=4639 RepID=A0A427AAJ3_ENSVE|nr:hypothetical protein B296_00033595 [Ensete ventricosum]
MGASDALTERVAFLRDSLQKSRTHTDRMVSMLGSFDHRLSALEAAMRPTQVRTYAIRMAHENIDKTLKSADVILGYFERTREVGALFLPSASCSNKSLRSNDGVVNQANNTLAKAIMKLEDEFRTLLVTHRDDPERLARPYRGVLKSHSTSADANRHDTGRLSAFALVSSIGNAFGLVVVFNSIIVGTDTRRASSTRRGVDIPGVLKTFRIVG